MSARDKLKNRSTANRERLSRSSAPTEQPASLDTPEARLAALSGVGKPGTSAPTVGESDTAPTRSAPRKTKKATTPSSKKPVTTPKRDEADSAELLTALTTRAIRGSSTATEKINVVIERDTLELLEQCEVALYRSKRIKIVRAALVSLAAQRATSDPDRYAQMRAAGSTAVLGSRIPSAIFDGLIEATYTTKPRLAYGPLVGTAMGEIVREVLASLD